MLAKLTFDVTVDDARVMHRGQALGEFSGDDLDVPLFELVACGTFLQAVLAELSPLAALSVQT